MASTIKLSAVTDPSLALELPGGEVKTYPLWATLRKLEAEEKAVPADGDTGAGFDAIRRAFDFPAEADARASGAFTFTDQMAFAVKAALLSDLKELPEAKKLLRE